MLTVLFQCCSFIIGECITTSASYLDIQSEWVSPDPGELYFIRQKCY